MACPWDDSALGLLTLVTIHALIVRGQPCTWRRASLSLKLVLLSLLCRLPRRLLLRPPLIRLSPLRFTITLRPLLRFQPNLLEPLGRIVYVPKLFTLHLFHEQYVLKPSKSRIDLIFICRKIDKPLY